jgi:hypothetical protein
MSRAAEDAGLVHCMWLLTQIPLSAKERGFADRLRDLGLQVSGRPLLLEIVGAFHDTVDAHLRNRGGRSDLGEMAQMAAAESLTALITERTPSLFKSTPEDVQGAIRSLSSPTQFRVLSHEFFSRFIRRYLGYFLSRELSNHVGGDGRFVNIDQHAEFNQALELHGRQAARIVETFAGGWFSKTNYEGGITPDKTAGFVHVALKKIGAELAKGNLADG